MTRCGLSAARPMSENGSTGRDDVIRWWSARLFRPSSNGLRLMENTSPQRLRYCLTVLARLLVLKVTFSIIFNYVDYYPADFNSDFLRGRELDFRGGYRWAFYTHIASGPVALILGTLLVSEWFRRRFPAWHRRVGRVQVVCVVFLVVPSGLWMANYAAAGPIAGAGLAALAVATGSCAALGWRTALNRRFAEHRRWMWRTYLLLCSAVVLRMIGGFVTVTGLAAPWIDPWAVWVSWLTPIAVFEWSRWDSRQARRSAASSSPA